MTKEFITQKGSFLAVEVPKESRFDLYPSGLYIKTDDPVLQYVELPSGEYEPIGLAKDLTEEQWKDIVQEYTEVLMNGEPFMKLKTPVYHNYISKGVLGDWMVKTATESGQSLMKSIGCNIVNPLGERPKRSDFDIQPGLKFYDSLMYINSLNEWQAEQDKLVNWLILRKK